MPPDLRRYRFWVHDYEPLPRSLAVQVAGAIGVVVGLLVALPFTTSLGDADVATIALVVLCVAILAGAVVFLVRARVDRPPRWMMVGGFGAGLVVGIAGQVVFSP